MPVVKTPTLTHGLKGFSPYTMSHCHSSRVEQPSRVKICAPYIDGDYSSPDFAPYGDCNDLTTSSFSQSMFPSPLFPETDTLDSGYRDQCPPSFSSPPLNETGTLYDELLDGALFSWPYEDSNGYDPSFSLIAESNSTEFYSPPIPFSPRSDSSGLSLSPRSRYHEYGNPFEFDFAMALPHEFPSSTTTTSMLPPDHHLRATTSPSPGPSLKSSSPTPSCSSLDPTEIKTSPSRDSSPLRSSIETDHRRRFPCLIIGCERRFTSQYTLKVHMEAHKPKPRSSFPCTLGCSEKFSRQHDRLRHEVAKHGKICEFSCEDCGRFFSTRKTLSNHKCPLAHGGTRWVTN